MLLQNKVNTAVRLLQTISRRKRKGFTLIELLVVVVIIGILASIALPSFVGAQDKARNAAVQSNVASIRLALEQYSTDFNGTYPTTATWTSTLATHNYLSANKLPRGPWSAQPQSTLITTSTAEVSAAAIANGTALPVLPSALVANGGTVPAVRPSAISDYGAIEYDNDPTSETYVVYGTGKRNKDAMLVSEASNNGQ